MKTVSSIYLINSTKCKLESNQHSKYLGQNTVILLASRPKWPREEADTVTYTHLGFIFVYIPGQQLSCVTFLTVLTIIKKKV